MKFRERLKPNYKFGHFDFEPVKRYELKSITTDGSRMYFVPSRRSAIIQDSNNPIYLEAYKSVTTIISEKSDTQWLDDWRDRIGHEEANAITTMAGNRGTDIHEMAEKYVRGQEWWDGRTSININDFRKLIPLLDAKISNIRGTELKLFSHHLKAAGTCDLVCNWNNEIAIVDYKTSRRMKTKDDILGYLIQATAYAVMFQELYGTRVDKIVVIILVDGEDAPLVFEEQPSHFFPKIQEFFEPREWWHHSSTCAREVLWRHSNPLFIR